VVIGHKKRVYESESDYEVKAEFTVKNVDSKDFVAMVIPGGVTYPDRLRRYDDVLGRRMDKERKAIASICHVTWVPISSRMVKGKKMVASFDKR
jgi:protease I